MESRNRDESYPNIADSEGAQEPRGPNSTEGMFRQAGNQREYQEDGITTARPNGGTGEEIRVVEEDVWKTLFNSPSGTMESLVLQQGDCNGPATYQNLMNHIFAPYIGVWMDVYCV